MEPFEIIAAPFTLYAAPLGTAFPALDEAPAVDWVKIGTSGDKNYNDDGVKVTHSQTLNPVRGAGSTGPRKVFRTEEDLIIVATVWDITAEAYQLGLNSNDITTVAAAAGEIGTKTISLYQGPGVATMALLARNDVSPYGDAMKMQYEVPACYMSSNPEPAFKKGDPAGLMLEFTALEDPNAPAEADSFGQLVIQHQAALP